VSIVFRFDMRLGVVTYNSPVPAGPVIKIVALKLKKLLLKIPVGLSSDGNPTARWRRRPRSQGTASRGRAGQESMARLREG
jgi:hypothetical protein